MTPAPGLFVEAIAARKSEPQSRDLHETHRLRRVPGEDRREVRQAEMVREDFPHHVAEVHAVVEVTIANVLHTSQDFQESQEKSCACNQAAFSSFLRFLPKKHSGEIRQCGKASPSE